MIGMATLGGCAYGPDGGGYYAAPSAIYARLPPPATFTGIPPDHSASAAFGSAAAGVTGTMAGTTGTATTVATEIGMAVEGPGTVPRAEGIQVTMDGIAEVRDR